MNNNFDHKDIVEAKSFFLRSDLNDLNSGKKHYDLEHEFAKTKKNRQLWVGGIIAVVVIVLILGAALATYLIRDKDASIQLNEDTFQDVDLSDILNQAKKMDNEIAEVREAIIKLTLEEESKINDIEEEAKQTLALLEKKGYSPGFLAQKQNIVYAEKNTASTEVKKEYDLKISREESRLAVLEKEKQNTNSDALKQAKEQSQVLNSKDKLHELEIKKIKDQHNSDLKILTAKYDKKVESLKKFQENMDSGTVALFDPIFRSYKARTILSTTINKDKAKELIPYFDKTQYGETRLAKDTEDLNKQIEEIESLLKLIDSIPFQNSPRLTINQLKYRVPSLLTQIKGYIPVYQTPEEPEFLGLEEGVTKDTLYVKAIGDYVENSGADGLVIYTDKQASLETNEKGEVLNGKIEIFLKTAFAKTVTEGTTAYVYPISGDTPKAIITIHRENGAIYGKFLSSETVSDATFLQPFDLIFFDLLEDK